MPDLSRIRPATLGEQLAERVSLRPWAETLHWLDHEAPDGQPLLIRINRLTTIDEEFRLDNMRKVAFSGGPVTVWRGMPDNSEIRPGDGVSLTRDYAGEHLGHVGVAAGVIKQLGQVLPDDVYWAGTDEREFFYLPGAWRKPDLSTEEYLKALTPEQVRILCDGEMASISRHQDKIAAVKHHVLATFDHDACGIYHGPEHWERVNLHAHAAARAAGVDPLVPHVFAWVHDSQREDDGLDPEHGPRAAKFIQAHRDDLFGFMTGEQVHDLTHACELHSKGATEGQPWVQACWDADRLDLGRVGITPEPKYLCTPYAKRGDVIQQATRMSIEQSDEEHGSRRSRAYRDAA